MRALAVDPEAALLEYLEMFYRLGVAGRTLHRMGAIEFATTLAPGLRDVLLTGKAKECVARKGRDGRPVYDAVVLDAPPTGDGNNTAAYACRPTRGSTSWSAHAYGRAVDVNPFMNPYTRDGSDIVLPELASAYLDRSWRRPGMNLPGSVVNRAFAAVVHANTFGAGDARAEADITVALDAGRSRGATALGLSQDFRHVIRLDASIGGETPDIYGVQLA